LLETHDIETPYLPKASLNNNYKQKKTQLCVDATIKKTKIKETLPLILCQRVVSITNSLKERKDEHLKLNKSCKYQYLNF